ncbi:MAG: hypothetical protein IPJ71_19815 [Bdellovibrionales bacterium]|nr:hypothetical protein [Bdellovibrionales bacterium]
MDRRVTVVRLKWAVVERAIAKAFSVYHLAGKSVWDFAKVFQGGVFKFNPE